MFLRGLVRTTALVTYGGDQSPNLETPTTHLSVGSPKHGPDGLRLEQRAQVSVGHLRLGQVPANLGRAGLPPGPVQAI